MFIGKLYVLKDEYNVLEEDGKYYEENVETSEKTERSLLDIALTISLRWSEDIDVTYDGTRYKAILSLPIYDGVELELYGYGESEEEASKFVKNKLDMFSSYYEKFEENRKRNRANFMNKVKKFAYFFKDREMSSLKDYSFNNVELIAEETPNAISFRQFAINNGVPKDARADDPIFGYIDEDNNIVFHKPYYLQGQRDLYIEFVKSHYQEVAEHYGLKEFKVYMNSLETIENYLEKNKNCSIEMLDADYAYYTPIMQYNY